jgi:hypothetical protein
MNLDDDDDEDDDSYSDADMMIMNTQNHSFTQAVTCFPLPAEAWL